MGEWSKLITVNFIGGFCGDFICSLVYKSHYKIELSLDTKINKVDFDNRLDLIQGGKFLRHLDMLANAVKNPDVARFTLQQIEKNLAYRDPHQRFIASLYKLCYDIDERMFINNVVAECRSMIPPNINDFFMLTHVTSSDAVPEFFMKNLFPGSINLAVVSSDKRFDGYFRVLAYHKFFGRFFTSSNLKYNLGALNFEQDKINESHDGSSLIENGEHKIFIDRFLFEDGFEYMKEVEDAFSKIFNKRIIFDRDLVANYKSANKSILAEHLNVSKNFKYDSKVNLNKLSAFMNKVQNKNG